MTAEATAAEPATLTTAQRIKIARTEKGWTQRQLAEATGLRQGHISRWESGQVRITAENLDRIMAAIGKTHTLQAVDGVLGIQGRAAGKLTIIDPYAEPRPVSWVAEGFVARGYVTMIAGEPGAGKSFVTQTLGVALANGGPEALGMRLDTRAACPDCGGMRAVACDEEPDDLGGHDQHDACDASGRVPCVTCDEEGHVPAPLRVLTIDAENGANLVQERAHSTGLAEAARDRYIVAGAEGFDIYKDRAVLDGILADLAAEGRPVDLVTLDSWTSLWFGNENVVDQVQSCLGSLNELAARHNVAILLIHHTDKEGETYRGSSAIAATIHAVFAFARGDEKNDTPETRFLTCKKMRFAAEPPVRRLAVTAHGIVPATL